MAFRIQPLTRPASRATALAAGCSSSSSSSPITPRRPLLLLFQSQQQQQKQQVRYARTMTRAEEEDLQGIPVRLLRDIVGFGRKHAIIRVKPGRMRNVWHHKGLAEYMTKQRFAELGVTEAAIGVRDRTFGTQTLVDESAADKEGKSSSSGGSSNNNIQNKKNNALLEGTKTQSPDENRAIFDAIIPKILTFARKPISTPEPAIPRSPALAANAAISTQSALQQDTDTTATKWAATAIFGSVTTGDVLDHIVAAAILRASTQSDAAAHRPGALQARDIVILGLEEDEDRIKRLGRFEVDIFTGGDGVPPLRRIVEVVPEGEA